MTKPRRKSNNDLVEILVVEDSPTQAAELEHILQESGYQTTTASNGKEALACIARRKPTVVITDIIMPEMDGYALCKRLKSDASLVGVPIILLTSLSDPKDVVRGLECGADYFITKPYDEKMLISRVQAVLSNLELRKTQKMHMGVEILIAGERHFITSDRMQILDFLISTYETAVQQNLELTEAHDKLNSLNEKLEEKVEERTADLTAEVAQRKRAEENLVKSKALLSETEKTGNIGGWEFDAEKLTQKWTEETFRILEIDVTEGEPKVPEGLDFIAPAFRPMADQAIRRAIEFGEPYDQEWEVITAKGNRRWVHAVARVYQEQSKTKRVSGSFQDITERKQLEAQLRQSQKMEAIGTLAGGIAHDFNNMLTGILGNIALMRSTLPPADPLLENLNAAETSARQAANLTKGLLAFSRRAVVLPVPINLTAALDATLTLLKQSLPATMEIVRDYEQTAWNVLLDQSHMTQILLNLAVNARDAMKGKGTLTIRARNETVDAAYVHEHPYARTGEFIHLSVTDTGPGIPPEILEHLFEPFHTTKPTGSGTGLGLSIVYGAVKQAGGWITAVSTEGVGKNAPQKYPSDWKNILGGIEQTCSGRNTPRIERTSSGATFDIYLPRCLEESIQSVTPSPLSVNAGSGTILVVEDEPVVCAVAQALLSRSGYTVLTAPDGASALNVLRDHPVGIGLILLDMTMPGMTTGEIVQAIRALDPTVPILLNSGYTSNGAVKQMLKEGSVQGFLPKPYELHELLSTVNQLMKRT
jgi:DNA-binding response OmpR family regulator/signal transduction histidine kinase